MKNTNRLRAFFLALAVLLPAAPARARTPEDQPLTRSLVRRLSRLPLGMTNQKSLAVRFPHVDSIQFYEAAIGSRSSFLNGHAVVPDGLSLVLQNQGQFGWANGTIHFKNPIDVSRYNSVVLWVRASRPGLRFWLAARDAAWTFPEHPQARTDILPLNGLPPGDAVQLVIPFSRIFPNAPVDYTRLSQLAFEFGHDTVGNGGGEIDVLGVAFVRQNHAVKRVVMVDRDSYILADAPFRQHAVEDVRSPAPLGRTLTAAALISVAEPVVKPVDQKAVPSVTSAMEPHVEIPTFSALAARRATRAAAVPDAPIAPDIEGRVSHDLAAAPAEPVAPVPTLLTERESDNWKKTQTVLSARARVRLTPVSAPAPLSDSWRRLVSILWAAAFIFVAIRAVIFIRRHVVPTVLISN